MAATAFSPILTADGDGAGERVDLGMAGPSLTDPAKNELECRRETVVVCRVCHRAYAKYTCPRCHTKYCDLACYKTHDPRCVESFHGDNLGNAMKGLRVEDEEKRRVTVLLAKYAPGGDSSRGGVPGETSGGSSETSSSESDESEEEDWDGDGLGDGFETKSGETKKNEKNNKRKNNARCVLSAANLRKLAAGETLVLADFTPDTLSKFERAARTGELSHMIHAWVPWWTSCSARDVALARNGSAMVEVRWVKSYGHSVRTNQDGDGNEDGVVGDETDKSNDDEPQIPAPPDEPLPPLASLLPPNVAPSAALRWHVLDVLAAYACVARVCDGEWRENPLSAARDLLAFSPTLAESAKGRGVGDVGDDAIDDRDHLAHGRAPATASGAMAGVAEAVTAAGATRAVAAAAAAAAASGLTRLDVLDILRCGRGCVVLALCDARRMVLAGIGEMRCGEVDDEFGEATAKTAATRRARKNKRNELKRVERKLFFLACFAAETNPGDGVLEFILSWCEKAAQKMQGQTRSEAPRGEGKGGPRQNKIVELS